MIRRRVVVHGRVQGVFFRDTTRRRAESRGVAGWVTNRPDGAVEAVFEGEPEAVEAMVRFAEEGPRGAAVERIDVSEEEPESLNGFAIR
jgi:acylphosphatase